MLLLLLTREPSLLRLQLLLELRLELRGDRGHRGGTGLEALLRLSLARVSGKLRLKLLRRLLLRLLLLLLHPRVASELLLQWRLTKTRGLGSKRARLLLLLLLLLPRLLSSHTERAAILLSAGPLAIATQEGVRVRIHGGRVGRTKEIGLEGS